MLSTGDKIGPYTIRERAGSGGMATVYKAWHEGLHRHEALKVPRSAGEADSAYVLRLLSEARVAARLHHPNIVAIHNVSEPSATIPFFAMDWVDAEDLAQILKLKKQFSLHQTIEILLPVAKALDYAHSQCVVHRDIKPANILLENKGGNWIPHVVDFGISRAAEDEEGATKLTKSGMLVGTPEYMSPEQVGSGEPVDYRTDIYSLGVVAYEMLCGTPPFTAGEGVSRLSILVAHVSQMAPLFERCPQFPQKIGEVLLRALAKQPKARPQTCAEFIEQLQAVSSEMPIDELLPLALGESDGNSPFDRTRFQVDDDATIVAHRPIETPVIASPLAALTAEPVTPATKVVETPPLTPPTLASRLEAAQASKKVAESKLAESSVEIPKPVIAQSAPSVPAVKRAPFSKLSMVGAGAALFLILGTGLSLSMRRFEKPATAANSEMKPKAQVSISKPVPIKAEPQTKLVAPRVRTINVTRMREIPFTTETRRTNDRLIGQQEIVQQGRPGAREVVLAITMQGDRELDRSRVSQRDVLQPVTQIVEVGTRQPLRKATPRRERVERSAPRREVRTVSAPKKRKVSAPRRRYVREAPLPP